MDRQSWQSKKILDLLGSRLRFMGSSVIWQLEFWHRALSAYGILSIGILAYGLLTMPLLAYSILAISINWHIQIIITAWIVNCVSELAIGLRGAQEHTLTQYLNNRNNLVLLCS